MNNEHENGKEEEKKDKEKRLFSVKNILIAITIVFILSAVAFYFAGIAGPIIIILLVLTTTAFYYSIYIFFAPRKIFFGGIKEATGKVIVVGTKQEPSFVRAAISYQGHDLNDKWDVVPKDQGHARSRFLKLMETLFPGLIFIGVPGKHWIYEYKFTWTSCDLEGNLHTRSKVLDYIFLKRDIYVSMLKGTEVGITFVPVDIQINITAIPINPYKALFEVQNWLEYIVNTIKSVLRNFIGQVGQDLTPEEQKILDGIKDPVAKSRAETEFYLKKAHAAFVSGKIDLGTAIYEKMEKSGDLKEFKEKIGIAVLKVEIPNIDYGALQELALKQYKAQQEGDAKIISETKEGQAYQARRGLEAIADVDYIKKTFTTIIDFGDQGVLLETLKALKATDKIITLGSIQNITDQFLGLKPGAIKPDAIADLLKKATGKELSDISKEDLEKILNVLKKTKEEIE